MCSHYNNIQIHMMYNLMCKCQIIITLKTCQSNEMSYLMQILPSVLVRLAWMEAPAKTGSTASDVPAQMVTQEPTVKLVSIAIIAFLRKSLNQINYRSMKIINYEKVTPPPLFFLPKEVKPQVLVQWKMKRSCTVIYTTDANVYV